jgi:hypothetical protein
MREEKYQLKANDDLLFFEFTSEGKKGKIQKLVHYSKMNRENIYNLAFGDKNLQTGELDDTSVTNNGDVRKVLTTVLNTVYAFFDKYPDTMVFLKGNTEARTRLYRIAISNNYEELSKDFEIYGFYKENWLKFRKNINFEAFLVELKIELI